MMVIENYTIENATKNKLLTVSPIDTMINGKCHTIQWAPFVQESDLTVFEFEVPKSRFYNISNSRSCYDDKIKVFIHDITTKVSIYLHFNYY